MAGVRLPQGYVLQERDADLLFLRRSDGSEVAVFSARGATREAIEAAAEGDLLRQAPQVAAAQERARGLPAERAPSSGTPGTRIRRRGETNARRST